MLDSLAPPSVINTREIPFPAGREGLVLPYTAPRTRLLQVESREGRRTQVSYGAPMKSSLRQSSTHPTVVKADPRPAHAGRTITSHTHQSPPRHRPSADRTKRGRRLPPAYCAGTLIVEFSTVDMLSVNSTTQTSFHGLRWHPIRSHWSWESRVLYGVGHPPPPSSTFFIKDAHFDRSSYSPNTSLSVCQQLLPPTPKYPPVFLGCLPVRTTTNEAESCQNAYTWDLVLQWGLWLGDEALWPH